MALEVHVAAPSLAQSVQAELCGVQWVLERRADGVRCVASDGGVVWDGMLGLPDERVPLVLEARPPRYPVEVTLDSEVVLAPGGVVRGWVSVPFELRLLAQRTYELVRLEAPGLQVGWREGEGYYHPLRARLTPAPRPEARGGRRFWVRSYFKNYGTDAVRPRRCRLAFDGWELWPLRGMPFGPCVEWTFGTGGGVRLRSLPGCSVEATTILKPIFRHFGETAS